MLIKKKFMDYRNHNREQRDQIIQSKNDSNIIRSYAQRGLYPSATKEK